MTLANMRENRAWVTRDPLRLCHHEAVMNVDAFAEAHSGTRIRPAAAAPRQHAALFECDCPSWDVCHERRAAWPTGNSPLWP
jgi:hypothetical protein